MNLRRWLTALLSLCLFGITSGWAQEAVEPLRTEEPVIETTPAATEESQPLPRPAKPAAAEESQPLPKPEAKPAKKSKEKSGEARASRDIQDSMTAQEFKSAGLDKLSESELQNLNAWLQGYRQKAETKAAEVAVTEAKQKSKSMFNGEAILSRVNDDNFAGVTGRSIITLEDGTVWKQANPDDRFKAQVTNHPPVKVSHGSFGYKMHIVGVPEFYVDPVRK